MKKETLKELIEIEFDRCETISHFKKEIFKLIDLYDKDKSNDKIECKLDDNSMNMLLYNLKEIKRKF